MNTYAKPIITHIGNFVELTNGSGEKSTESYWDKENSQWVFSKYGSYS